MTSITRRRLLGSTILLYSVAAVGACTTHESMLEQTVSNWSASSDMLTAGIKPADTADPQNTSTALTFFIVNGTKTKTDLLIWNTPLEQPLSADVFSVQFNAQKLAYQGRKIKRGSPQPEHFRTIDVEESIEVLVDLANYYDMSAPGEYSVSLDPAIIDGNHQFNDKTPINIIPATLTITVP